MLAIGLALTALVTAVLAYVTGERDRRLFEARAQATQDSIVERVRISIALLRGVAGLLASQGEEITVRSFGAYMAPLALRERYPGILGIGFTVRVAPGTGEALERRMRAQGHEGFRIWPRSATDESHSIIFLEPLDQRNRAAIGYDMYSEEVRRAAMARARDTGEPAASGVVELVQEIDERKQPGFLIYVPVYRGAQVPPSVEERRRELLGFAYAPIRAADFIAAGFSHGAAPPFSVDHEQAGGPGRRLYEHRATAARPGTPRFEHRLAADLAGQRWTFAFRSLESVVHAALLPLVAALAGLTVTLLLGMLSWRDAKARGVIQAALEREQAARRDAERANVMKDEFLATLSHELRTPLNAIVGWAAVLRSARLPEDQLRAAAEAINRNALAQARLIEDLLDMSRIVAGKASIHVQALNPAAVLDEAISSVAQAAEAKGLRIQKIVDSSPLTVRGDPARLQQVIWNLLSNAIKFTPPGGRIQVSLERADSSMRLTVSDTGEGIEAQFMERIFDRFSQADASNTRRHGGLGLGLAIVRELVSLHGGTVRAHSPGRGQGATFIVELPLMIVHAELPGPPARKVPEASLRGIRVLVVDDEADARELIRVILTERDAEVRCAASAAEALALLREFRPDVLLSDIGMPGTNGYDLIRAVRNLSPAQGGAVPAAALTAYARDEDRLEALRAGYQTHLVKPASPDEVVAVVAALAGSG